MLRSDIRRAYLRAPTSDHHPDLECQQKVQELLMAVAEIDRAYEGDLETVRTSDAPIAIKQTVINTLRRRHQERRAAYLGSMEEMKKEMVPRRPDGCSSDATSNSQNR